jgi:voltage-gated potassium channel
MEKNSIKLAIPWEIVLVIAAFLCAFVIPVFPPAWGRTPVTIGFTFLFISGFMTIVKRKWIILYLVVAAFVMEWVSNVLDWVIIAEISRSLNILFFIIVIFSLIREMSTAKVVTARVILSSISGYLLLGFVYSGIIAAIIQRDPDAYNIILLRNGIQDATTHLSESMYYGFITLANLGYGDIVPLKPYSRSLATLISISGQLYIATIIGILIGKFVASDLTTHKEHETQKN